MPKVIPTDLPSKASVWTSDTIFLIDGDDNNTMKRADANTFRWPQWPQGVQWSIGPQWPDWPQWPKGDTGPQWPEWPAGAWSGDMLRSVYDTNNDGKVNSAVVADTAWSVPWNGITGNAIHPNISAYMWPDQNGLTLLNAFLWSKPNITSAAPMILAINVTGTMLCRPVVVLDHSRTYNIWANQMPESSDVYVYVDNAIVWYASISTALNRGDLVIPFNNEITIGGNFQLKIEIQSTSDDVLVIDPIRLYLRTWPMLRATSSVTLATT